MDLHPIGIQETTNKIVEREPKASWKKIHETNALPLTRCRGGLLARSMYLSRAGGRQEALRAKPVEVGSLHDGFPPITLEFLQNSSDRGGGGPSGGLRLALDRKEQWQNGRTRGLELGWRRKW